MKSIFLYFFPSFEQSMKSVVSFSLFFYVIGSIFCFLFNLFLYYKFNIFYFGEKNTKNKILFDILKTNHKLFPNLRSVVLHKYGISYEYLQFYTLLFFTITYLYLFNLQYKKKINYYYFNPLLICYFIINTSLFIFFSYLRSVVPTTTLTKYENIDLSFFQILFYLFFGICFGISIAFLFYSIFIFFIKQYFNKTIINKTNLKKDDDYFNISNPF